MKRTKTAQKDIFENSPDWYWDYGLHDAEILEAIELELPRDWRAADPKWNCLELVLDARGAIFDTSVRKIALFNYKILSGNIDDLKEGKIWWMGDTLSEIDGDHVLDIEFERPNGSRFDLKIKFQTAEVYREGKPQK